eukprot:TRINITY_DN2776_c1_g1_i4.p1 TRINITY_DN2776_c1_g1~~TRINITY_DN2776_c1_g1_i4.p1  ORF type:complete len:121 (+),score=1.41 TRINITY_DN2776_c1_g1_i4:554-916(+)
MWVERGEGLGNGYQTGTEILQRAQGPSLFNKVVVYKNSNRTGMCNDGVCIPSFSLSLSLSLSLFRVGAQPLEERQIRRRQTCPLFRDMENHYLNHYLNLYSDSLTRNPTTTIIAAGLSFP